MQRLQKPTLVDLAGSRIGCRAQGLRKRPCVYYVQRNWLPNVRVVTRALPILEAYSLGPVQTEASKAPVSHTRDQDLERTLPTFKE